MRSVNRICFFAIILLSSVTLSCESEEPLSLDRNERMIAQGFWQARAEDVIALQQGGISVLGWFAIDAMSSPDSVSVTWPDPLGCTSSREEFDGERKLNFSTAEAEITFSFLHEKTAAATYSQGGETATLIYQKTSEDPSVICF